MHKPKTPTQNKPGIPTKPASPKPNTPRSDTPKSNPKRSGNLPQTGSKDSIMLIYVGLLVIAIAVGIFFKAKTRK